MNPTEVQEQYHKDLAALFTRTEENLKLQGFTELQIKAIIEGVQVTYGLKSILSLLLRSASTPVQAQTFGRVVETLLNKTTIVMGCALLDPNTKDAKAEVQRCSAPQIKLLEELSKLSNEADLKMAELARNPRLVSVNGSILQ